ncbi:MAG: 23S rRNA (uracil(1939)-C(5))-methyltransferase RlmD [Deltaproteobacteria bacterium]|nr:23S rRNA (uracil(1939)-C(5))-methyltransferase RlmD [Deltaproteobacteria bacterium]
MTNLTIEKIILGGMGLAHLADGMVVLIADVLPGEEVRANIRRRHKGYAEGELLEVVKPSAHRLVPVCPNFAHCGGCKLMYADYALQCQIKADCLREVLARTLKNYRRYELPVDFIPAAKPLHYRQRIRLQADAQGRLGYFQARTHRQVNIQACLLAEPVLNEVMAVLAAAPEMIKWGGALAAVDLLFSPLDEQVVLILHLKRRVRLADRKAADAIAGRAGRVKTIWLAAAGAAMDGPYAGQGDLAGDDLAIRFLLRSGDGQTLAMGLEAGGFCQVNLSQNDELIKRMLAWAKIGANERVLDLYCGLGNLSLPMARCAGEVVGIDVQRATIRSARYNARRNNINNCRFIRADVGEALRELLKDEVRFDLIILDPPRQGCKNISNYLPQFGARRLIYISCDPATLARDLNILAAGGYKLLKICGLDMFPQTSHLETIALLGRVTLSGDT